MKTVIHVHTTYSYDANAAPADVVQTARRQGVDCVAITDHDEIRGALEAQALGEVQVIVGEEISSRDGHLIGLFLQERIPPGLPAEQTAQLIREQGGLVLAPHPRALLCESSLDAATLERLVPWLDAVEVCNAQNPLWWEDRRAGCFARRHGIAAYVGADTHLRGYLATAHQLMPPFDGPAGFLSSLRQAELHAGRFGLAYLAAMGTQHVWHRLARQPLPGFGVNAPEYRPASALR